jgi:hypothetical protein
MTTLSLGLLLLISTCLGGTAPADLQKGGELRPPAGRQQGRTYVKNQCLEEPWASVVIKIWLPLTLF